LNTDDVGFGGLSHIVGGPEWQALLHVHSVGTEVIVVLRGEIHVELSGQHIEGVAGDVLVYGPGEPHEEHAVSDRL
jgi:quercetin dioxygenase-like cupin family protein